MGPNNQGWMCARGGGRLGDIDFERGNPPPALLMLFCNDALLTAGVKGIPSFRALPCLAVKIRTWLSRFRALAQPPSIFFERKSTTWPHVVAASPATTPPQPKTCGLVETHWFRSSGPHLEVHTSRAFLFLCLRREARPSWDGYGWAGQCTAIERVELIPKLDRTVIAWLRNGTYILPLPIRYKRQTDNIFSGTNPTLSWWCIDSSATLGGFSGTKDDEKVRRERAERDFSRVWHHLEPMYDNME